MPTTADLIALLDNIPHHDRYNSSPMIYARRRWSPNPDATLLAGEQDIYAVLTYYVRHPNDVAAYLSEREQVGAEVRAKIEAQFPTEGLRARLLARQQ